MVWAQQLSTGPEEEEGCSQLKLEGEYSFEGDEHYLGLAKTLELTEQSDNIVTLLLT